MRLSPYLPGFTDELEKIGGVASGALMGGLIGGGLGAKNRSRGALIGAAIGGGAGLAQSVSKRLLGHTKRQEYMSQLPAPSPPGYIPSWAGEGGAGNYPR